MSATTIEKYPYSPGLEGVPAGTTRISDIDVERSSLQYRGYDVHDLAEHGSFEETAFLLLHGHLPTQAELDGFNERLGAERDVPDAVYDTIRALPKHAHPMDQIRTALSALAPFDPEYTAGPTDHAANVRKAERILAKAGTMVANGHRIRNGQKPLKANPKHRTAQSLVSIMLLDGGEPDPKVLQVMDASMTLYAEHGFNASTFACRVTVSTLADLYCGVVSGVCALRGALHGGANEEAMRMILEIGEPDRAQAWIDDALTNKKKVMGFGHREYKHGDSRAAYMSKVAHELGEEKGIVKYGQIADVLERTMADRKGIFPNVDFPTGYAYYLLGIPIDVYTPIFVSARVSGWTAHAIEQLDNNRIIRPKQIYEGDQNLRYVPIAQR